MRFGKQGIPFLTGAIMAIVLCMFMLAVSSCRQVHAADAFTTLAPSPDAVMQRAIAVSQQQHTACYILVCAEWCGPCHQVEKLYWPTLQRRGWTVHMDADKHAKYVRQLAQLTGRAITNLPTLVVIEAGRVARVVVGAPAIRVYTESGK